MNVDINKFIPEVSEIMKWFKYGFLMAALMLTSIFGGDIRAFYNGANSIDGNDVIKEINGRVKDLEYENVAKRATLDQVAENSKLIRQMQITQTEIATQLRITSVLISEMQAREYARLTKE